MMRFCKILALGLSALSLVLLLAPTAICQTEQMEANGVEDEVEFQQDHFPADLSALSSMLKSRGALMIADSTADTVGLFDPYDGTYLGDIINGTGYFSTPIEALVGPDGDIYVSDQVADAVFVFDTLGTYLYTYADASDGLDNIRGIDFRGDHLFVTNAGGGYFVAEFDGPHSRLPDFINDGSDPFDILFLNDGTCLLADIGDDVISFYNADGTFGYDLFATAFPEQVQFDLDAPGDYLTNSFSDYQIIDFELDGTIVQYTPTPSSGRGVYRLGNGNLLHTDGTGVKELEPGTGTLIELKYAGSGRYINLMGDFVQEPKVDIKCNGSDSNVIIPDGNNVTLTVDVLANDYPGFPVEIWVLARNLNNGNMFTYGGSMWKPGICNVYYQGGLMDLSETVLDMPLPEGKYDAYLAIDLYPNGQINLPFIYKYDFVGFEVKVFTGFTEDFDDGIADGFVYDPAVFWCTSGVFYGDPNVFQKYTAYYGGFDYADFTLSCDVMQVDTGDASISYDYGLIFRSDGTIMNCYEIYVETDGSVYLVRHVNSSSGTTLMSVTTSANMNIGLGQWNNIKVTAFGDTIEVYINNAFEFSVTDTQYTTGKVGMAVQGTGIYEQEYEFDNFMLMF